MISLTFTIIFMSGCPAENSLGKGGAVVSAVISLESIGEFKGRERWWLGYQYRC